MGSRSRTAADTSRALSVDGLFQAARERMPETARIRCFETTKKAFEALLADRTGQDLSFIAGSLYLAGEIRTAAAAWMASSVTQPSRVNAPARVRRSAARQAGQPRAAPRSSTRVRT